MRLVDNKANNIHSVSTPGASAWSERRLFEGSLHRRAPAADGFRHHLLFSVISVRPLPPMEFVTADGSKEHSQILILTVRIRREP